jgi:hypothetical protein
MECTASSYVLLYLSMGIGVVAGMLFAALLTMSRRESEHHDEDCERRVLARQTEAAGARFEMLRKKKRNTDRRTIAQRGTDPRVIP